VTPVCSCCCVLVVGYVMSKAASLCLFCLGPDCCSLATCDSSDLSVFYTRRVVRQMTKSPQLLSLLTSTKPSCLDQMRVCSRPSSLSVSHRLIWLNCVQKKKTGASIWLWPMNKRWAALFPFPKVPALCGLRWLGGVVVRALDS